MPFEQPLQLFSIYSVLLDELQYPNVILRPSGSQRNRHQMFRRHDPGCDVFNRGCNRLRQSLPLQIIAQRKKLYWPVADRLIAYCGATPADNQAFIPTAAKREAHDEAASRQN